jgi:hypothetical protein
MAKITQADVHAAAADLDAQGIKPTTTKVREKLGRGSFSTIQEYLSSYDLQLDDNEQPETPEELAELLPVIWSKAWSIASAIQQETIDALEQRLKEADIEIKTLKAFVDQLETANDELTIIRTQEAKELDLLTTAYQSQKLDNMYLKGRLAAYEDKELEHAKMFPDPDKPQAEQLQTIAKKNKKPKVVKEEQQDLEQL